MTAITIYSDFGAQKIKSDTVSTVFPSIFHEVMGPDAMILVLWIHTLKHTHKYNENISNKRKYKRLTYWAKQTKNNIDQLKAEVTKI